MRSPIPRLMLLASLCLAIGLPPAMATAQLAAPGETKVKTKRRSNGRSDLFKSDVDERVDERREDRVEAREDWQEYWDEDEDRYERERLQDARAGSHGKACIYGRKGEVIHQPVGVECSTTPPGPKPLPSQ